MEKLEFYVYCGKVLFKGNLKSCIEYYKTYTLGNIYSHIAIGVTQGDGSCDLLIETSEKGMWISNDYKSSERFGNNAMIYRNTINILKREFEI